MNYTLTTPCDLCPFLKSMRHGFTSKQLEDHASGEFACHKTCDVSDETGTFEPSKKSAHCAGALIYLEKRNRPHQMMRICERVGLYDRRKLNKEAFKRVR